jgi:hypothetical protein
VNVDVCEIRLELFDARFDPARGRTFERVTHRSEPTVGQLVKSDMSRTLNAAEFPNLVAKVRKPPVGKLAVVGFERASKLLAASFDQTIVSA